MFPVPERAFRRELLDAVDGSVTSGELAGSLADIRTVNRRLGGIKSSLYHLERLSAGVTGRTEGTLSILDVGSGSADIPLEMVRWAKRRGMSLRVVALDISSPIVSHAAAFTAGCPEIEHVVGDGLMLPFADRSFDIVHCSMALHHFTEQDAGQLLSGIARVARRGYIVCDLRRSWAAYVLIYVLSRLLTGNRMTRNDGPVSVLRSFTPSELSELAAGAGLEKATVRRHPFWRMALVGEVA